MSGIAGFLNRDGSGADPTLIEAMQQFLVQRGPDGSSNVVDGAAAMCHSLLRTVEQHEREQQPITLRHLTISADARIDGQDELIGRIRAKGISAAQGMSDAELILAAYDAWGESCVDYLLGDFAFAIWDGKRQSFFLARDQLGVKPFFYFLSDDVCVFSNTLDCVLMHPAVPDRLSDRAIADFLLFGMLRDHSTTVYDEVHRLSPGHSLAVGRDKFVLREYWELPIDEPLYLGKANVYIERFLHHLNVAVSDRLRVPTVGILMSGGLDSPSIAAAASKILGGRYGVESVKAFSNSQPTADDEHKYAKLAAETLGIPIEFLENRDIDAPADWTDSRWHTPQPVPFANYTAGFHDRCRIYSSHSRVAFYGEGPDNALMFEWKSHCRELVRNRRFVRVARDVILDAFFHRRIPTPSGLFWPSARRTTQPAADDVPSWLNKEFERSVDARGRARELRNRRSRLHPYRPLAYQSIRETFWGALFESYDSASTTAHFEMRHPFADLRLLRFLLAVPVLPWCRGKYLIRRSMRGTLPDKVLSRPKTPLRRELWSERVLAQGRPKLVACEELERYIDLERFAKSGESDEDFWTDFRVASLSFWLANKNARQTRTEKAR